MSDVLDPRKQGKVNGADRENFDAQRDEEVEDDDDDGVVDYSTVPTYRVQFTLRGVSPLLMHNFPPEEVENVLLRGNRPLKDTTSTLRDIAERGLYTDNQGRIAIPRKVLFGVCKQAGRGIKLTGVTKMSSKEETKFGSFVKLEDDSLLVTPGDWEPSIERGLMNGKVAVAIVRPRFKIWSLTGIMIVLEHGGFNLEKAFQLLDIAGDQCGIGAWRPKKNGECGRFEVTQFDHMRVQIEGRPTFKQVARAVTSFDEAAV